VNAALVQTMVASEGVSTPERVGGVVRMAPPIFTTQKLRRWKRFRLEILPLVPRMDLASALRAAFYFRGGNALGAAGHLFKSDGGDVFLFLRKREQPINLF